jgi:Na+/proline symporter
VAVFGMVAYGLALGAGSIFELVQQANGIGSAGILVLVVFGLFSRHGGARAGYAALLFGLGVWAYGTWIAEWTCPYLFSLVASLGAFVLMICTGSKRGPAPGEP